MHPSLLQHASRYDGWRVGGAARHAEEDARLPAPFDENPNSRHCVRTIGGVFTCRDPHDWNEWSSQHGRRLAQEQWRWAASNGLPSGICHPHASNPHRNHRKHPSGTTYTDSDDDTVTRKERRGALRFAPARGPTDWRHARHTGNWATADYHTIGSAHIHPPTTSAFGGWKICELPLRSNNPGAHGRIHIPRTPKCGCGHG